MTDTLHPAIRPLAFLLGTWKGAGRGDFPTAHPFEYGDDGNVEFVAAQPTGIAEVLVGPLNGTGFDLRSTGILLTPTAKETVAIGRDFTINGDRLR